MANDTLIARSQKELTTERLIISRLSTDDAAFIMTLTNSPGWLKNIGDRDTNSIEKSAQYIVKQSNDPNVNYWKVSIRSNKVPIGVITLIKRDHLEGCDIGYAFLPEYGKQGYAFEATQAVLDAILYKFPNEKIYAITSPDNIRSANLLKKLGMTLIEPQLQDGQTQHVYRVTVEHVAIQTLVTRFFNVFNNINEQLPNLDLLHELCLPEVMIIKKEGTDQTVYNLESFIAPRKKILEDGTLTYFEEYEIECSTDVHGNIAQRQSNYEKRGIQVGKPFKQIGHKFFQFIKTGQGWKISSVIWEDRT